MGWKYVPGPGGMSQGVPIPGEPEHFPDVVVSTAEEEAAWAQRGWTIGATEALRAAYTHEASGPPATTSEDEDRNHASSPSIAVPRKRRSGAQWRKRRREQLQGDGSQQDVQA